MRGAVCALVLTLGACAATPHAERVEVVGAFDLGSGPDVDAVAVLRVGGLSGLVMDGADLLAISDDHSPRVITFRVHDRPFRVEPTGMISLRHAPVPLDPEAIALLPNRHLLIASEGSGNPEARIPPGIFEFTHDGDFIRSLPVRSKFLPPPAGPLVAGARRNASFESLTVSPDGNRLFTAVETALVQDGEPATLERGARVRLMEYVRQGETFVPGREWAYDTEPVPAAGFTIGSSVQGLVELIALNDHELLALERSFVQEQGDGSRSSNFIRLFRVSLGGATDISQRDSIAGDSSVRPASKQLVVDLKDAPGLPPALANLDNFEGMTFIGPPAGGPRRLLLVSDDNFSARQRTWFVELQL